MTDKLQELIDSKRQLKGTAMFGESANEIVRGLMLEYGAFIAAQCYQAFGLVDDESLREGEWERCMDWISKVAIEEVPVDDLLPIEAAETNPS